MGLAENILSEPVSKLSLRDLTTVRSGDTIAAAIGAMHDARIGCVVDDAGRAVGLTGQRGVMEYICDHFPRQVLGSRVSDRPYLKERESA